jgi:hypothetical protein
MINDDVIKEIYKRFPKPAKDKSKLNISYYQKLLQPNNPIAVDDEMIVVEKVEEFSPFKKFLIRSLNAILEIDDSVAFVFTTHIVFLKINECDFMVHLPPEKEENFISKIFHKRK